MFVIRNQKFFLGLSVFFMVLSIVAISVYGLRWGIDFTGGTLMEVEREGGFSFSELEALKETIEQSIDATVLLQPSEENGLLIRTRTLSEEEHRMVLSALEKETTEASEVIEKRFDSVGPVIGQELRSKSYWAIGIVVVLIVLYIAFAFRKVSKPVSSWKFGVVAIISLVHNILIPIGLFALLGHYFLEYQIDALFVTALLAIFGFSVNDTIVIFDRIRENLGKVQERSPKPFREIVGESISQTLSRSFNISLAIMLVLLTLYFIGSDATREFSFVLGLGVLFGTYSSICFASPLLVVAEKIQKKK